jgi:excisionase family DNA binding protein
MKNPFEVIEARLSSIENLILDLKHQPKPVEDATNAEQLFTIDQAAKFLNLTKPTLYSKVSRAELPYMKQGKRLYFSRTELMDYLKQGRRKTNDEIAAEAHTYLKRGRA